MHGGDDLAGTIGERRRVSEASRGTYKSISALQRSAGPGNKFTCGGELSQAYVVGGGEPGLGGGAVAMARGWSDWQAQ